MTERKCGRSGVNCKQPVVAVLHFGQCSDCRRSDDVPYCAQHRDRILEEDREYEWACTLRGCHGGQRFERIVEGEYEIARAQYLETFLITDKEVMLASVTLEEPANWDMWGNVLAEPVRVPEPQRRKVGELRLADTVGFVPVWVLGIFAVCLAILGVVGLFSL